LAAQEERLFVGGKFAAVERFPRKNAAAFDAASGSISDWNPNATGPVQSLEILGEKVFLQRMPVG
jgi:hypothetical protein